MPSSHNFHGKVVKMTADLLGGGTAPTLMFAIDTLDSREYPDEYQVAHVVWFPKMEEVPNVVGRLRFVADQLGAIYYKHTSPAKRIAVLPKPNLAVLEQEWAEHEVVSCQGEGHDVGQCPDCPSPEDDD